MPLVINYNNPAEAALTRLNQTQQLLARSIERLSSGRRINRAADDAAGLAIAEKMAAQVNGLTQAIANAKDAISLIQTAEGALNEVHAILQRMRQLAVQAASDSMEASDRLEIQLEIDQLARELSRISNTTEFNKKNLLAGGFVDQVFQIGPNAGQNVTLSIRALDAASLGVTAAVGAYMGENRTLAAVALPSGSPLESGRYRVEGSVASEATAAQLTLGTNNLVITANSRGAAGNDIKVAIVNDTAEGVTVDMATKTITVRANITGGATWSHVRDLINGDALASSLVTAALGAGGDGAATATAATNLSGGSDATVSLVLKDAQGNVVSTAVSANDASGRALPVVFQVGSASALQVQLNAGYVNGLAVGNAVDAVTVDVVASNSRPAVVGAGGVVFQEAQVFGGLRVHTAAAAQEAITRIDAAIQAVSDERAKLGALQNRLEHTIGNLSEAARNLSSALSGIRDVDMARETAEFMRAQILSQVGVSMLRQANVLPQAVLELLR